MTLFGSSPAPCLAAPPQAAGPEQRYQLVGPPSDEVAQAVREITAAAQAGARKGIEKARAALQKATDEAKTDPRPHLALALLLIEKHRYGEARELLAQATTGSRHMYWPAWKAAIWLHLLGKDASTTLRLLEQLAERARKLGAAGASKLIDADAAAWLGRAIACLEGPLAKHGLEPQLDRIQRLLKQVLGKEEYQAYSEQRDRVLQRYQELTKVLEAQEQAAQKGEAERRQQLKELINQARRTIDEQIRAANDEAKKWDEWLQQELDAIEKQRAAAEQRRIELETDLRHLAVAIDSARAREAFYVALALDAEENGHHELAAYYSSLASTWQLEAASQLAGYARTEALLAGTLGDLRRLELQRHAAAEQHRRHRRRIMQEITQLRRTRFAVERRLAKTLRNKEANRARQLKAIFSSVRTYMYYDPTRERTLLLESLPPDKK